MGEQGWIGMRSDGAPFVPGIPMSIVWWIGVAIVAGWILTKTRFGNWIYATGGDANVARNVGVPVARVKIILFIGTACAATLLACIQVMEAGSADTLRGTLKEFEAIIAAVIGGVLLTGGYGTVIGAILGALIFGLVQMGIFYTGIDTDWFKVFLGAMILIAVLVNNYIRAKALGERTLGDEHGSGDRTPRRLASISARSSRSATSTSRSIPARSIACSATTAPASRR